MKKYIIDGNNLIGKIHSLAILQNKDRQASREKLAYLIDKFFKGKKIGVILNLDGYENQKISVPKVKLVYSDNISADEKIKKQIETERNRRNIVVVTSDNNIRAFAKVCGCEIISSEEFGKEITKRQNSDDEESRIKAMDDIIAFKKIFDV